MGCPFSFKLKEEGMNNMIAVTTVIILPHTLQLSHIFVFNGDFYFRRHSIIKPHPKFV